MKNKVMTPEEKKLLLKDLCARLPYGVILQLTLWEEKTADGRLTGIDEDCNLTADVPADCAFSVEGVKPYLRPMSSMTEEEAKEIAVLHDIKDILSVKVTSDYINVIVDDGVCSTETRTIWYDEIISSIEIFDWLNKYHFDYRGLIPKDFAIAVTEDNNPYKE